MNHSIKQLGSSFNIIILILSGMMMASCGKAGTEEENPVPDTTDVATDTQITPDIDAEENQSLDNLYIDAYNNMRSVVDLSLNIQLDVERSFLSVCSNLAENLDFNTFDYSRCMLRAPMDNTSRIFKLTLPGHIENLTAIIWFYEKGKTPLIYHWQRSAQSNYVQSYFWTI